MIEINLRDILLADNLRALAELKKTGMYSDEELQKIYDEQVKADMEKAND